jgi:hypothetical protein
MTDRAFGWPKARIGHSEAQAQGPGPAELRDDLLREPKVATDRSGEQAWGWEPPKDMSTFVGRRHVW